MALIAGLGAIALGYRAGLAEEACCWLRWRRGAAGRAGAAVAAVLGGVLAAATGRRSALDSPPEAISLRDANLTLIGTALGAHAAVGADRGDRRAAHRAWQRIGARILGSWIAASAILVLALLLVR